VRAQPAPAGRRSGGWAVRHRVGAIGE
jgi:hypothetical protein